MQTGPLAQVEIIAEAIGSASGSQAAQALLQVARALRAGLARAGVAARVSGDIGGPEFPAGGRRLVVALRAGAYPAAPGRLCVLHPFVPRHESEAFAKLVSRHLSAATGEAWPPVLLWGALAVTKGSNGSAPAPAVAVYLGTDVALLGAAMETTQRALAAAVLEAVGGAPPASVPGGAAAPVPGRAWARGGVTAGPPQKPPVSAGDVGRDAPAPTGGRGAEQAAPSPAGPAAPPQAADAAVLGEAGVVVVEQPVATVVPAGDAVVVHSTPALVEPEQPLRAAAAAVLAEPVVSSGDAAVVIATLAPGALERPMRAPDGAGRAEPVLPAAAEPRVDAGASVQHQMFGEPAGPAATAAGVPPAQRTAQPAASVLHREAPGGTPPRPAPAAESVAERPVKAGASVLHQGSRALPPAADAVDRTGDGEAARPPHHVRPVGAEGDVFMAAPSPMWADAPAGPAATAAPAPREGAGAGPREAGPQPVLETAPVRGHSRSTTSSGGSRQGRGGGTGQGSTRDPAIGRDQKRDRTRTLAQSQPSPDPGPPAGDANAERADATPPGDGGSG